MSHVLRTEEILAKKSSAANGNGKTRVDSNGDDLTDRIRYVSLSGETRRRYLNYALSVITSRALPDVRDGLKPVQRRILYVMYHENRLTADSKRRKCAKICGDTTGNFHPHGDAAVYEALVRLAQDFTFRYPFVDGQGNFGSFIGLPHAAARYTEARLTAIAEEMMEELRYQTVDMRPNYDATRDEPIVLPARFPNLLVNGTQGIAVGMATNIPPHNLTEVVNACVYMIGQPKATVAQVMKYIKAPDFPLGGRIVTDRKTLKKAYIEGRGSIKVRGEWKHESTRRKNAPPRVFIYSVPYGVETGPLLSEIGSIVAGRKLPQLIDVIDETNEKNGLLVALELKSKNDAEAVMAYLYKHTHLEQNFNYNATCLMPDEQGVLVPRRSDLVVILRQFLDFRFDTIRRRFEYQLRQLERRIHILEGFAKVFRGLDRALKIIRRSKGKQDAATKLMKAFPLDEVQATAILELQLYRISKLEIDQILAELADKRKEAARIRRILASKRRMWGVVKSELQDLSNRFGDRRRTSLGSSDEITEFDAQAYIVRENTNVVITREGWCKRVGRTAKIENTRLRDGDSVLDALPGSTLDNVVLFASDGSAYTLPVDQIPASSGYGDPISKHVRWGDGVSLVGAVTTDARFTDEDRKYRSEPTPRPFILVVTERGQVMRVSLSHFRAVSTKVGRKYCRLRKGDRVVFAELVTKAKTMFVATRKARVIHFPIKEVPILAGPGIGVIGIKLASGDLVLGARQLSRPSDALRVKNSNDKVVSFGQTKYNVTSRGGKGVRTSQRNEFTEIVSPAIEMIDWTEMEED